MTACPECQEDLKPSWKLCPNCGEAVQPAAAPAPPPPAERGESAPLRDVGMVKGDVNIREDRSSRADGGVAKIDSVGQLILHGGGGSSPAGAAAADHCPICGRWVSAEGTFRCRQCERPFLCHAHQDERSFLCVECSPPAEPAPVERPAAHAPAPGPPAEPARDSEGPTGTVAASGLSFLEVNSSGCEVYLREKDSARMILVPGGTFTMGTDEGADESPAHQVTLDAYLLQETPVTWQQYRAYCAATGAREPREPAWGRPQDDHPVVNVSWDDARKYCAWAGGRLPTEAEWERAARGDDGRTYPWGEDEPSERLAAFGRDHDQGPDPVARHPAGRGPFGHHDLSGNVYEWCADWYDEEYYAASPRKNPGGPASSDEGRVLRGGSFNFDSHYLRGANRTFNHPSNRAYYFGFRCAQDVP